MRKSIVLVSLVLGVATLGVTLLPGTLAAQAVTTGSLQAQIDSNTSQIASLTQKIAEYQAALQKVGADKKTLQAAINSLDLQRKKLETQVTLVQRQIDSTQLQIKQLGSGIAKTQSEIDADRAALGASMRNIQLADEQPLVAQMVSSHSLPELWSEIDSSEQLLHAIRANVAKLLAHKQSLATSQSASKQKQEVLTSQKKSLATEQQSLSATKQSKAQLLADTKAQESNYQKLLAQAKAELAAYSAFTTNAGGSKLLANQTSCDDWGCYYSQRDTIWGNVPLSGTNERLAASGCLVTSMAMMFTHYGYHDVTPVSVNANPSNFSPAGGLLLFTINVGGATATRYKVATIDATLATGNPVVVGIHAYGGTHYVVLTSGSRGSYLMRDPYVANGKDVSFTAHYSVGSIFGISKVIITS
ncbi:MAG: hypothetical protein JWN18_721 [Parcubacteria group bacterium]|nr:hypothetical protein [Parcubacteria group bacterium]